VSVFNSNARRTFGSSLTAAALLCGAATVPAHAANTIEVNGTSTPGSVSFTASAKGAIEFETNYGIPTQCATGSFTGILNRGVSGGVGMHLGTLNIFLLDNCLTTGLGFETDFVQKDVVANWTIHTTEVPAKGQRYVGIEIRNISMRWLDANRGPGDYRHAANLTGTIPGVIDTVKNSVIIDSPEVIEIDALDSWADKGNPVDYTMGGEIWDGDLMSMQAEFNLNVDIEIV
jgi:hypothetical protein